jgi:branched-chain amino acid transport system substrate-binding protein
VAELVSRLPAAEAARLWNIVPQDSLAQAYLGKRVAADRRALGDERGAVAAFAESRRARQRAGLEAGSGANENVARAVGVLLPLSGKQRALGERALRGALLAADLLAVSGSAASPLEIKVRDTGSDPARAVAAVDELAKEGVAAIVGSPDRAEALTAAPRAAELGLPFIELSPDEVRRGETTFKMVRQADARARALARLAVQAHARTVAVLAPDSGYGRAMAAAFVDEAHKLGAHVVADLRYPESTTTFVEPVKRLHQAAPALLFVPAPATQLMLIAPQLTASGVTRMPGVKPSGKPAQLYATADGINEKFLLSTAKYLDGAVLAPVFFADTGDATIAAFVDRYQTAYAEEPSSLDALAFDAVRAVRIALDRVAGQGRAAIANSLSRIGDNGLTGELSFSGTGERVGAVPLYVVDNGTVRARK